MPFWIIVWLILAALGIRRVPGWIILLVFLGAWALSRLLEFLERSGRTMESNPSLPTSSDHRSEYKALPAKYPAADVPTVPSPAQVPPAHDSGAPPSTTRRPYRRARVDHLEQVAAAAWNSLDRLLELHRELELRSRPRALRLKESVAERIAELQVEAN